MLIVLGLLMALSAPAAATDILGVRLAEAPALDAAELLYYELRLAGVLEREVFLAGFRSMERHGLDAGTLAIADMSQPSTRERLYVFDLEAKALVLRTLVAHGSGSGGLMAERFSNAQGSHQTSLGLYRVGREIVSPKHGPAFSSQGSSRA